MTPPPDHRARLVDALAGAVTELEWTQVTVAEVVRRARTSRRTFYEHFTSREDALVQLVVAEHRAIIATIAASVNAAEPWQDQIRTAITTWLAQMQRSPALSRVWVRVLPNLAGEAQPLIEAATAAYADLVQDLLARSIPLHPEMTLPDAPTVTMLLGGLREAIARTVENGEDVRDLTEPAVRFATRVLAPDA